MAPPAPIGGAVSVPMALSSTGSARSFTIHGVVGCLRHVGTLLRVHGLSRLEPPHCLRRSTQLALSSAAVLFVDHPPYGLVEACAHPRWLCAVPCRLVRRECLERCHSYGHPVVGQGLSEEGVHLPLCQGRNGS